jgi:hypothetical protein
LLLLGAWLGQAACAQAQEHAARDQPASLRLEPLAGYQMAGSLGFRLIDTPIDEQLYRRTDDGAHALVWSARFMSRWSLTEDQLERWSAQAIGLLADATADGAATPVQLAGWERLDASDVGERRVAYRYALAAPSGERVGEATIVVFARGTEVGLTGATALGTAAAVDARAVARALDTTLRTTALVAQVR